jgi:hypothetical protein
MCNAKRQWSGVKLAIIGLWSSGNALSGVMNHASPPGCPTDESGFGRCQENATCLNCKVWWRRKWSGAIFLWFKLGPLVPEKGNLNANTFKDILDDSMF